MPFSIKSNPIGKLLILFSVFLLIAGPVNAQNKKKKKYKKKSDANLISRGYNDVTTRNNYYFNTRLVYLEMLADIELQYERDYDDILPLYFHQKVADFSTYESEIETILDKTSIVMQLHDNTRWKDDVYLMLGKARYLNGEYYDAIRTFQFVVTTMKEDVGKSKGKVNNKAKLKAQKAKEAAKRAKERKKEIDKKKQEVKDALAKLKRDKQKQMSDNSKSKQKSIQKKINAKKKIIALRKKGKTPSQKLLDIAYPKDDDGELVDTDDAEKDEEAVEEEKEEDFITYKVDYRSDKKIKKQEEAARQHELAELNDTIPMTEKEIEKFDDLTLWDKIKHKSSRAEALVWMAKSYMKIGEMASAQSMLEYAEALPKLTRSQREGIYAGEAYYYIDNRRFDNAIDALTNAADIAKKKDRSFYQFISAQLRERQDSPTEAIDLYRSIAEGKADYRMKYNANMRMLTLLEEDGTYSDETILELLTKLLKNGSNKEFRDEIHYRIAGVYASREEIDMTIEHLEASITNSKSNMLQKSMSFSELGEVYLLMNNYEAAGIFYDSAVAVMPIDHESYEDLLVRASAIENVAKQAEIIEQTDSLLLLSNMSDQDLEIYLADLEIRKKVEEKKKRRKSSSVTSFIDEAVDVQTTSNFASADWYFYNPNLRNQGFNQFKSSWGDRLHEHNWRRINKEGSFDISNITDVEDTKNDIDLVISDVKIDLPIPSTPEEIKDAHKRLAAAYYEIGKLFYNHLELNADASQAFESLVARYPEFERIDRAYYYLYLIYTEDGNLARADHYKNILLTNYPVSQYAYAINNTYQGRGDGEEEYRPEPGPVAILYASTYDMFVDGKYTDVIQSRNDVYETYKENPLMPKFDFLEALSYGHLDSLIVLKSKLTSIIAKYPNNVVEKKAREYLAIIDKKENENGFEDTVVVASDTDTTTFVSIYKNEESNNIFGMMVVKDKSVDVRQMIQLLDQFNSNNFIERKLRVSNAYLTKDTPLILIKRFREKDMAIEYIDTLADSMEDIFGAKNSKSLNLMMITNDNFRTLFTTKKLEEYQVFFNQTY